MKPCAEPAVGVTDRSFIFDFGSGSPRITVRATADAGAIQFRVR